MLKRLFRQERKKEEDIELNNSSNETMKETDHSTTSPESNPIVEPETTNQLKDRIRRVRISRLKKEKGTIYKDLNLHMNKTALDTYPGNADEAIEANDDSNPHSEKAVDTYPDPGNANEATEANENSNPEEAVEYFR